jgi:hypothetical protein
VVGRIGMELEININNKGDGNEEKNGKNGSIKSGVSEKNRVKSEEITSSLGMESMQNSLMIFDKSEWLTTAEAATHLRKLHLNGVPSLNAVHKMVSLGKIRRRKFFGRLYFKRKELDYLIESSGS